MCADVVNHIDKIPRLHIVVLCHLRFILKPSLVLTQFHTAPWFHAHGADVLTFRWGFAVRIVQIELTSFLPVAVPPFRSFIGLHAGKLERFTQTEYWKIQLQNVRAFVLRFCFVVELFTLIRELKAAEIFQKSKTFWNFFAACFAACFVVAFFNFLI